jgi:hypothetical protein
MKIVFIVGGSVDKMLLGCWLLNLSRFSSLLGATCMSATVLSVYVGGGGEVGRWGEAGEVRRVGGEVRRVGVEVCTMVCCISKECALTLKVVLYH